VTVDKLRISVAMCTRNGERFLSQQLKSVAAQTRPPDELVISDDCSTDNTAVLVQEFAASAPFDVFFFPNNLCLGTTKNFDKAISLCQYEIIVLSDQDDIWHPQKLDRLAKTLVDCGRFGAVFSDAKLIDEDSRPLEKSLWTSYRVSLRDQKKFERGQGLGVLLKHDSITGATMAFRGSFRKLVLPIPSKQLHDLWIATLIAAVSHIAPIRQQLVSYRQHCAQQIGPGKEFSFWQKLPRRVGPDFYLREVDRLGEISARLEERAAMFPPHHNALSLIRQKINHRKARAEFPSSKLLRLPAVIREAVTLRYWRYSNGFGSVAKDLLV
jgi:glycosyltransferase involved in cell wall biosynthesis